MRKNIDAAVGTPSHQHGLEACTVCDLATKSYESKNVLKNDEVVLHLFALN